MPKSESEREAKASAIAAENIQSFTLNCVEVVKLSGAMNSKTRQ